MSKESDLGPGVLGEARYRELQAIKAATDDGRLGPGVTGPLPVPASDPSLDVSRETAPAPVEGVSVDQLRRILADDPNLVADLARLELQRGDRRKTALAVLIATERAKGPAADDVLVEQLGDALRDLGGG